jgi:hypothetical protein
VVFEDGPAPGDLPLSASVERDGVRVTIALERNPMPAGEPTWMAAEVRNVGDDDLLYADPCSLVGIAGTVADQTWRPGIAWPGEDGRLKDWALDSLVLADGDVHVGFNPEWAVAQGIGREDLACRLVLRVMRLAPGEAVSARALWDGWTTASYAPPPGGPITLAGSFSFYWRESEGLGDPPDAHERRIDIGIDSWIVGLAEPPLVHPGEAIDIALADPAFGPELRDGEVLDGRWYLRYVPGQRAWHVARRGDIAPPTRIAVVDAFSGQVREILDKS